MSDPIAWITLAILFGIVEFGIALYIATAK